MPGITNGFGSTLLEQGGNCPWNGQGRGDFLGIEVSLELRFPWLQSQQGLALPAGNRDGIRVPVTPQAAQVGIPPLSFACGKANSSQGKNFLWMLENLGFL